MSRYTIFGVDRAGIPWVVGLHDAPSVVLERLGQLRRAFPALHHAVYDSESPESGDCEARLEEMVAEGEPCN